MGVAAPPALDAASEMEVAPALAVAEPG